MIYDYLKFLLNDMVYSFLLSFGCSLLVALLFFILGLSWPRISEAVKLEKRKFRKFFGKDIKDISKLFLVSDSFYIRQEIRNINQFLKDQGIDLGTKEGDIDKIGNYPFIKILPDRQPWAFSGTDFLVIFRTLKAISYLNAELSKIFHDMPQIINDEEGHEKWSQGTFFCIGSPASNIMSLHILDIGKTVKMNNEGITIYRDKKVLKNYRISKKPIIHDYALIYKAHNVHQPGHSLIVCAGIGEWGTSSAAKYLATKWKSLYRKYGSKDFLIVLEVLPKSDDAVSVVYESPPKSCFAKCLQNIFCKSKKEIDDSSSIEEGSISDAPEQTQKNEESPMKINASYGSEVIVAQASAYFDDLTKGLDEESYSIPGAISTKTPTASGSIDDDNDKEHSD